MTKTRFLAAAAILSALIASPALAGDMNHPRAMSQRSYDANAYQRSDRGFWPADVAAGVVGGAVGAAGAIATAPFRGADAYAYDDGYNGYDGDYRYSQSYAARNGFVCQPGTMFRGEDGRAHLCQ
ncbi:MAG TPA: hypothetical protein VIQ05_19540 [Tardiphaga sp.]